MTEQSKPEETTKTTTAPKPVAPSPASFAHKTRVVAQAPTISYSEEDIKAAKTFTVLMKMALFTLLKTVLSVRLVNTPLALLKKR